MALASPSSEAPFSSSSSSSRADALGSRDWRSVSLASCTFCRAELSAPLASSLPNIRAEVMTGGVPYDELNLLGPGVR